MNFTSNKSKSSNNSNIDNDTQPTSRTSISSFHSIHSISTPSEVDLGLDPEEEEGTELTELNPKKKYNRNVAFSPNSSASSLSLGEEPISKEIKVPYIPDLRTSRSERLLWTFMARKGKARPFLVGKKLLFLHSVFVSLGVFLFGYDQGVMSGIITGMDFKAYFNQPTRAELGTMVAILEIGALVSSLAVGRIGDIIGRRWTIFWGSSIFIIGGAIQTLTIGYKSMIMGRIIAGLGVGTLSTIVPVYQSEISPAHNRGFLACLEFTGNIVGYSSSVWLDYVCSFIQSDLSWRIPLGMQVVMGSLLMFGSLLIHESPRWLLDNDFDEYGMRVIANLHGGGDPKNANAIKEYREIKEDVLTQRAEPTKSYVDMFKRYYKRVLIACSAQMFAQLNGINVISYYAPLVFEQAGWVGRDAILMTGINSLIYVASTLPPWFLVDRWGRRFILMSGATVMCISLICISYFIHLDNRFTPPMVVLFVMIYNAFFGYSWGPIPWLYPPEILPLSIRAKGASLSTATNWVFNWLVGETTPILQASMGYQMYLLLAFFCGSSVVLVYFQFPETKGVPLEEMDVLFGDQSVMPTPAFSARRGGGGSSSGIASPFGGRGGHVYSQSPVRSPRMPPQQQAGSQSPRPSFKKNEIDPPEIEDDIDEEGDEEESRGRRGRGGGGSSSTNDNSSSSRKSDRKNNNLGLFQSLLAKATGKDDDRSSSGGEYSRVNQRGD